MERNIVIRSINIVCFCCLSLIGFSQPVADGFLRGKGNLDLAPSLTLENYQQYYSKLNHVNGGVGRTASVSYILWGRNVGQAFALSLAYVHRIHFGKS